MKDKVAVSLVGVHTHTHTRLLNEKIKKRRKNRKKQY